MRAEIYCTGAVPWVILGVETHSHSPLACFTLDQKTLYRGGNNVDVSNSVLLNYGSGRM